ncbi:MAG: CocE/NonD family hydrolase, partial [Clostridiales bacterium]|nr:CocE/NonD family hydrolase [Clostridiales bacterium]
MHLKKHFWPVAAVLMLALVLCLSATALADVGNESLQENLKQFPNLYSEETGTTMPIFSTSGNIMEAVYVECPLDTDFDGKRDLVRVTIRRPAESNLEGIRVPVIMQDSPYIDGAGVDCPDHYVSIFPFKVNASTGHFTYVDDVESVKPRASEWPWGDEANDKLGIPASRGAMPVVAAPRVTSVYGTDFSSFVTYLIARGYALVSCDSIGNRYTDGYTSCGDVDETVAGMAVIQWLNGNCRAYTDQTCTQEVIATDWCNGNVAMSGVSYDGTLPIALACSGVEGLKAVIPASAISSWYDYYRENGLVIAPGTYQGEDADVLAKYCFSRGRVSTAGIASSLAYFNNTPNMFGIGIRDQFYLNMDQMEIDQDRDTGDYNRFWDDRNYLATADKVTAGIIVTHGLADWNVKMKQFDQFYRAIKEKSDAPIRLILHRGGHSGIYTHEPFLFNAHKWLDHFLYGIENNIVEDMPEISVISSQTGQYEFFDSWPVSKDEYTKYYLNTDGNGAAGTLSLEVPAATQKKFKDNLQNWNSSQKLNASQLTTWETRIYNIAGLTAASTERLAFVSDVTENVRFSGTVKATLEIASAEPFGVMTAALV